MKNPKILSYSKSANLTQEKVVQNTQVFIPLYGEYGMYVDLRIEFDNNNPDDYTLVCLENLVK